MNRRLDRYFYILVVVGILIAILIWNSVYRQAGAQVADNQCRISFLNVGQADAALISLPNSIQILIDGGRDVSAVSEIEKQMPSFDRKIEYVVATHPDSDHIGGLPSVLESYEIGEFIQSEKKADSKVFAKLQELIVQKNIPIHIAQKDETINFSAGAFAKVLSPDEKQIDSLSSNDSSIVLRFGCGSSYVILTGDAQIEAQDRIANDNPSENLSAQIFKIAHHGAQNSFSENLINKVKPEFAVISVGKNSYGHPASFVLSELQKLNIKFFRTDQNGTVNFVSNSLVWQKQ